MQTENPNLQNILIRAYQYVIARFDVDGFRIDLSRILNDEEIVVVVNTNAAQGISVDVIVDNHLNRPGALQNEEIRLV